MLLRVLAGLFLFMAAGQQGEAAFTATASGCTIRSNTGPGAVEAIVTDKDCTGFSGDIDTAYARSGPGGLGASANHLHTCCDTGTGAAGFARALTSFMITGPAGPVTISLNLALTGTVGGGVALDTSVREIRIDALVNSVPAFGIYRETTGASGVRLDREGALVRPGDLCATGCGIPTVDVEVMANTWISMELQLSASSGGGIGDHSGWADASHTLYFPLDRPVFNLPEGGYSADIPEMNVAGNRVIREDTPGGAIPEPATYVLVGGGLVFSFLVRSGRRRQRKLH